MSVSVERAARPAPAGALVAAPPAATTAPRAWDRAERAIDLVVACALLLLLLPVLLVCALAIRLETPGPALFRQRRVGRHGREFTVLKFRTMAAGCDAAPHERYVRALIERPGDAPSDGGLYKLSGDPRVTRVGRWLRRTSLDELPQLLNVVAGDMSLVGPRPVIPYEVAVYPEWYAPRFEVRPGLTGLWQVSGRNRCSYEDMVRMDIAYARNRSPRLYMEILARTVPAVLLRREAA